MTDKQVRFVQEYLVDLNAAAAARRAGYANGNAHKLLASRQVRKAVDEALAKQEQYSVIRREQVIAQLGKIAFAQGSDCSGAQVKLASQLKALELLGKHLGLFEGRGGSLEPVVVVEDV